MALDTLGVVSREYRKRLLLRNLINSDEPQRLFDLGLAILLPQQYTTQQSENRQFIASAISIKNLIDNTFRGGGGGPSNNPSTRAFIQQDYTYDKPYIKGDVAGLRNAADQIVENPPSDRKTYDVTAFKTPLNISTDTGGDQDIPTTQELKSQIQSSTGIKQFYWEKNDTFEIGDKKDLLSFTQSILKNYKSGSIGEVIDQTKTRI